MHKKFEINRTKIKGGCQPGRKVVTYNSKSDLPIKVHLELQKEGFIGNTLYVFGDTL